MTCPPRSAGSCTAMTGRFALDTTVTFGCFQHTDAHPRVFGTRYSDSPRTITAGLVMASPFGSHGRGGLLTPVGRGGGFCLRFSGALPAPRGSLSREKMLWTP